MTRILVLLFVVFACSPETKPRPEPCRRQLAAEPGIDLSLSASGSCRGTLRLALRIATGDPESPTWQPPAAAPIEVLGEWTLEKDGAVRTLTVKNTSSQTVGFVGLEWTTGDSGLVLDVDRMLQNGYQSWAYAGVLEIPAKLTDMAGTAPHGGDDADLTSEIHGVSWWWTALSGEASHGVVAGATSARVLKTYFAANAEPKPRLRIVEGVSGGVITLAPGATKKLDGLFVTVGPLGSGLDAYAAAVVREHAGLSPRPALGGWGSWNVYYEHPTADLLRLDMQWAKTMLVPLGLTDFLLDDGYETHWGSWIAKPEFGASLEELNAEQSDAGLRPAVWMAPFYVLETDPLIGTHPDWFVRKKDGSLHLYDNVGSMYAALDVTHPDARQFVVDAVKRFVQWGYKSLKIDFLFGGAIEGTRQGDLTSLEAYQLWMKTLREALPDTHLVGCGAPFLPSVGWVDSMRTGPDIGFSVLPEPQYSLYAAQARSSAMRAFTDAWWAIDPDVVILRGRTLSDAEAWMAIVSGAIVGGNYVLGDGRQSSALRQSMALDPEVLAMTRDGVSARPLDVMKIVDRDLIITPLFDPPGRTRLPHVWRKTSADGAQSWLAVFGWFEGYTGRVNLPEGAHELVPPASSSEAVTRRRTGGARSLSVPAREVRLFTW